jgi:hypothetical protein
MVPEPEAIPPWDRANQHAGWKIVGLGFQVAGIDQPGERSPSPGTLHGISVLSLEGRLEFPVTQRQCSRRP